VRHRPIGAVFGGILDGRGEALSEPIDLRADLSELVQLAVRLERVDDLIVRALDALGGAIPHELAAMLELRGTTLSVRVARGRLANDRVRAHTLRLEDHPKLRAVLDARRACVLDESEHAQGEGDPYDGVLDLPHGHSCMAVPLFAGERTFGLLTFDNRTCGLYGPGVVDVATAYGHVLGLALAAAEQAATLDRSRRGLEEHNRLLEDELGADSGAVVAFERAESPVMQRVRQIAKQVAAADAPVLITGETGTGKEVLARAIHAWSTRREMPFVKINCAALPSSLIESELFGHVKGAFSGAVKDRPGRFVVANGGTLLLDEIGDMPIDLQPKLLRVLQEGVLQPVGSDRSVRVDVRVIAATHVDLDLAIERGRLREDLYYRLSVVPIDLPPLRDRLEDIEQLVASILDGIHRRSGRGPWTLKREAIPRLRAYAWPGNIRELVNALERACILSTGTELDVDVVERVRRGPASDGRGPAPEAWPTLEQLEKEYVERVLQKTEGRIYGERGAAEILGVPPSTLQSRLTRMGIKRTPP
jgi:transcriptional regulator with GAF, ATPase, and Fis domain